MVTAKPRVRPRSCRVPLMAWMLFLASCASGDDHPVPDRGARARDFTRCPHLTVAVTPPGFIRSDSELKALPRHHMGEVVTYRDGARTLKTYSGVDAEEELEDLDFAASSFEAGVHKFRILRTENDPGLRLATIEDQATPAPCNALSVLSRGLSDSELERVLVGVRLQVSK